MTPFLLNWGVYGLVGVGPGNGKGCFVVGFIFGFYEVVKDPFGL